MPGFSIHSTLPTAPEEQASRAAAISAHRDPSQLRGQLRRFLVCAILLLTASCSFLDYWSYSRSEHADPSAWQRLATGQGIAPAQYRIGIYFTANFFKHLASHHGALLPFRYIFTIADFLCTGLSLAVLFFLLTRIPAFRRATLQVQWAHVLFALLLVEFYLGWSLWFQEPETMPSLAILSASALLCSGTLRISRGMQAAILILVALLGATVRVDAVIAFHGGFLLALVLTMLGVTRGSFPLGRMGQAGISVASLLCALGVEYFIAHHLFPQAVRDVALVQLPVNLYAHNGLLVLLLSLPVWVLTLWRAATQWKLLDGWAHALVLGSLVDFAMFMTFGMSEEVRIFLPFLLILLPLSVPLLLEWFQGEPAGA